MTQIEQIFYFPIAWRQQDRYPRQHLRKPGKLDDEEFKVMKTHPEKFAKSLMLCSRILVWVHFVASVLRVILPSFTMRQSDGSGYPKGLKGDAIPIEARINEVADVFGALTSCCANKAPWSNDEAFAMLQRLVDTKFDRDCVDHMLKYTERDLEFSSISMTKKWSNSKATAG